MAWGSSVATGELIFHSRAFAACTPATGIGTPSNATVTCSGITNNQNTLNGYGTAVQNNNIVNVLAGASVTGTNDGLILGDGNTVNLATGASITSPDTGAQFGAGTTTINNNNGGTIAGNGNSAVVNGIAASGGTLVVNNTGTISGTSTAAPGAAVGINANGDVIVNSNSGSIMAHANGISAVALQGTNVTITSNTGNITASGNGFLGVGVEATNLTIASNSGTISATGTNTVATIGLFATGSLTVTSNTGLISGSSIGIALTSGVTSANITNGVGGIIQATAASNSAGISSTATTPLVITNLGTISGGSDAIRADTAVIANDAGGLISGGTGIGFQSGNAAASIFNAGTITGTGGIAIQFSVGSVGNTLTLAPGSAINGNVVGAGADILQLGGSGNGTFNLGSIGASQQYRGFSTFNKIDGSTWTLSGAGNQAWTVSGGTLLVDGTAGAVNVTAGTLGGIGTVGTTTIGAASLSPGHAGLGTLSVNGSLLLSTASNYLIAVSGASVGQTTVSGSVSLGGAATAVFEGSPLLSRYVIVSAAGGRTGTFSTFAAVDLPAFITASLAYTPTEVDLTLSSNLGQTSGLTRNQAAVANAIDRAFNGGSATADRCTPGGAVSTSNGSRLENGKAEPVMGEASLIDQSSRERTRASRNAFETLPVELPKALSGFGSGTERGPLVVVASQSGPPRKPTKRASDGDGKSPVLISPIRIRYIMEYIYVQSDQTFSSKSCGNRSVLAPFPTHLTVALHGIFRLS